jgi:hypothetical protein
MQSLGIFDSASRSERRFKSLLWPSIESRADVDCLAIQGYWVCTVVAALSLAVLLASGQPIFAVFTLLFFYLGGVGVREHSRYAATVVFVFYAMDTLLFLKSIVALPGGAIALRVIIAALLLSILRATWTAVYWQSGLDEVAKPLRLGDSWLDKFANEWPSWLWPKIRIVYYVLSVGLLSWIGIGLASVYLLLYLTAYPHQTPGLR